MRVFIDGRLSADCRPTVGQLSANCRPTVGHLSADRQPTVGGGELFFTFTGKFPFLLLHMQAASIFLTDRSKRNHKMHTDRSVSSHLNFSKNYVTSLDFKRKILCFSHSKWLY